MTFQIENQIRFVTNFHDLILSTWQDEINVICWKRELKGDFLEIVQKISVKENIKLIEEDELNALTLSEQGQIARSLILNDLALLKAHGAAPVLNLIKAYERDLSNPIFPTDVYSYHVDRSPIASDTFLCTYYGESSEILPNLFAEQKVLVPEIRNELEKQLNGTDENFETYISENFYDLHYRAKPNANPISLGKGYLCRLAVDYPESPTLPCIHRAPIEKNGQSRLMLIC